MVEAAASGAGREPVRREARITCSAAVWHGVGGGGGLSTPTPFPYPFPPFPLPPPDFTIPLHDFTLIPFATATALPPGHIPPSPTSQPPRRCPYSLLNISFIHLATADITQPLRTTMPQFFSTSLPSVIRTAVQSSMQASNAIAPNGIHHHYGLPDKHWVITQRRPIRLCLRSACEIVCLTSPDEL